MSIILTNTTRSNPKLPFLEIKNDILGSDYELSVALVGETRARSINKRSRNKTYAPNVLSFPLTRKAGELYLCPVVANKEAASFEHSKRKHLMFLYIHGLLHLRGLDHGRKMESLEETYLKKYS
ncbi:rRNA maturation RNase YbeY [Candidatus Kaiserbacteria bacterium CG10_big_fil_rev_8_21_14_0_10_44_10]|uniref:Endoribonuclease YbeY n=1 Tax=Candidatus Kaiserbacteria bacterium CG10_big_fil_rev_8_21_14_0_10_44_10 TaxID=1974606 RepID=A0A2H0UHL7_9BACT|nr:MAG: rRNA maturation RNase YbeY [Candidatus Kaiserbacteria bacterium CG10_big_fil_rev_8_21_14_0_10_44_10]